MNKLIEMDELKKENKQLEQDLYIALNKIDKVIEILYDDNLCHVEKLQEIHKILGGKDE